MRMRIDPPIPSTSTSLNRDTETAENVPRGTVRPHACVRRQLIFQGSRHIVNVDVRVHMLEDQGTKNPYNPF